MINDNNNNNNYTVMIISNKLSQFTYQQIFVHQSSREFHKHHQVLNSYTHLIPIFFFLVLSSEYLKIKISLTIMTPSIFKEVFSNNQMITLSFYIVVEVTSKVFYT
jgi:hypothetical protein